MNEKKLLVLNGGYTELPLIVEAKRLGWHVITSGNNRAGLGHAYADENIFGDYSDCEFVYRLAREQKVSAIVSGGNDFAYISTAYACERLNLPGHDSFETAKLVHSKINFRRVMRELGLPTPKFSLVETIEEARSSSRTIGFPLVVKPTDLTSGFGVSVCRSEDGLESAFDRAKRASRQSKILLEEFIVGTYHAANVFLRDCRVVQSFFDDEQYYLNPYMVSGASSPSSLRHYTMAQTLVFIERLAERLKLADGMFHVQFIERAGTPFLIDPCRRAPGDLYPRLIEHSTGFNCARAIVRAELGEPFEFPEPRTPKFIARECIMPDRNGVVEEILIDRSMEDRIIDRMIWAKRGDRIEDHLKYKAGILFLSFDGFDEMQRALSKFHELVRVKCIE